MKALKEEVQKGLKLRAELDLAKRDQSISQIKLGNARRDKDNADTSINQTRLSTHSICKIVTTDRKWLETEMSRRSVLSRAMCQKSESELTTIKRKLSLDL